MKAPTNRLGIDELPDMPEITDWAYLEGSSPGASQFIADFIPEDSQDWTPEAPEEALFLNEIRLSLQGNPKPVEEDTGEALEQFMRRLVLIVDRAMELLITQEYDESPFQYGELGARFTIMIGSDYFGVEYEMKIMEETLLVCRMRDYHILHQMPTDKDQIMATFLAESGWQAIHEVTQREMT